MVGGAAIREVELDIAEGADFIITYFAKEAAAKLSVISAEAGI